MPTADVNNRHCSTCVLIFYQLFCFTIFADWQTAIFADSSQSLWKYAIRPNA